MSRTSLGRAAMLSLALGASTVACTPTTDTGHVASAGDISRRSTSDAARLAGHARAALAAHQTAKAVDLAERAVAADPGDAGYRLLLGQAYLATGRFASAETSLRDVVTMIPDNPRAGLQLALAEIADGRSADARARLAALDGRVSDGDLGLALALAGDRAHAIDMLSKLVRSGKSDARGRQNLALALALDDRWRESRAVAMQDVGPDRIDDQIARWSALASAKDPRAQVAALLGTTPATADPGQPARLALAPSEPPVAFAAATPVAPPRVASVVPAPAPIVRVAAPAPPLPMLALAAPVTRASAMPALPATPVLLAAATPAIETVPAVPALLAAPRPRSAQRSYARIAARRPVAPGPVFAARASGWVVQLGAYSRTDALETAWSKVSRLTPNLATFTPVSGRTSATGAALVRLSVSGFAERRDATRLCEQIKLRGGACFVRASGNDTPWQWARRETGTRVAMAQAMRRG